VGVVIALGGFTAAAKTLAKSTRVSLIDGDEYTKLLHRAGSVLPNLPVWTVVPPRPNVLVAVGCVCLAVASILIATLGSTVRPNDEAVMHHVADLRARIR
jgi:hypothetical protein